MEVRPARARRRDGGLIRGSQVFACGLDDLEIRRSGDGYEPFADRVDQVSVAADQSWDSHALGERATLDSGFEDVGDASVDSTEQCLEATEHPRLDHGVRSQRLEATDSVGGFARGDRAVAERPSDVAQLSWMRE